MVSLEMAPLTAGVTTDSAYAPVIIQTASRRPLWITTLKMAIFYVLSIVVMAGHLVFFIRLDGQPVETSGVRQSISSALANFLALLAEMFLSAGIAVAYDNLAKRSLDRKALPARTADTLLGLPDSPWNLFRLSMLRHAGPVKWLIGLMCFLIPVAAMFPPGALTVEFRNSVRPTVLRDVPTMNISDIGDLTHRSYMDHMLYTSAADLEVGATLPRLSAIADVVLATGAPVDWPSPCNGPCSYSMVMEGPRFHCRNQSREESLIQDCDRALIFEAREWAKAIDREWMGNNSFQVSWLANPMSSDNRTCEGDGLRSIDCSTSRATYKFDIANAEDGTRTIKTEILGDDEDMWTEESPIQTYYYYYWFDGNGVFDKPVNEDDLRKNFTNSQAYVIRRAAVESLVGDINLYNDGGPDYHTRLIMPNGTFAAGSPYFGLEERFDPHIHFTEDTLQQYIQDLLISTISLNPRSAPIWVNSEPIEAMEGADTYLFEEQVQFYVPYGASLAVAACIYIAGVRAMWKRGTAGT